MKRIRYRATYQKVGGTNSYTDIIGVNAQNINSGFKKATDIAIKNLPKYVEIVSLEFWEVQ